MVVLHSAGDEPLTLNGPAVISLPLSLMSEGTQEAAARILQCEWEAHYLRIQNRVLSGDLSMIGRRVGHDIRMHLGGIVSTADLLSDLIQRPGDSQQQLLHSVQQSVEEILVLLDRVKAIVMSSNPALSEFDSMVGDVAAAEAQRLQTRLEAQSASLTQPDNWPPVRGVHPWLKVIWSSLLTNAIQHGGKGVKIETGWDRNGDWRFWVKDNGPGVAEDRQANLFPAIESLYEPQAAPGIGLAIVRRLTEKMGGRCGYESPPGGGACFWFTLPAGQPGRDETAPVS
ncbi:MAG TPA: HAMP domain-containing sensor histidine kinase [Verrucomicrobiales bacterium]|nr:HAMP domain-containing sensor histidine kinase [Verrucomicrobiales bacterium]